MYVSIIVLIPKLAKGGPGSAYYFHAEMFEPRHNILSNVRADIGKYSGSNIRVNVIGGTRTYIPLTSSESSLR